MSQKNQNKKRSVWGTRLGFYFAAIGAAFGLGNVWRFPYVVAENGGGAFVLLYIFLLFLLGLPLLIAELTLGKSTRRSIIAALSRIKRPQINEKGQSIQNSNSLIEVNHSSWWVRQMHWVGKVSVLLAIVVLSYFAVISGWVLYFLIHSIGSLFFSLGFSSDEVLQNLMESGWLQIILTSIHLAVTSLIVARDLEKGMERWVGFMMPAFGVLVIALIFKTLSLPHSDDALRFLFYPDFSRLDFGSPSEAIGHVFFTLSIGFGSMVTFGSYLRDQVFIPEAGVRVTTIDCIISLGAGLLIFPIYLSSQSGFPGPELLFRTVPGLFRDMSGGLWFGAGFFLCLYLAALGASIGLLETIVSNVSDTQMARRGKTAWILGLLCILISTVPALSTNVLNDVQVRGAGLLELSDSLLINWILPVAALLVSQGVVYGISDETKKNEFFRKTEEDDPIQTRLYTQWVFILKWVVPTVIIGALLLQIYGLF